MSSSDASDLVDSDESGAAEPPRKKRVLAERPTASTRCGARKKPRRLARRGAAAVGLGRSKAKAKAAGSPKPPGRSRRSAGKSKPQSGHSSSSWHCNSDSSSSSSSSSGGDGNSGDSESSDHDGRPKRNRTPCGAASSRTVTPRTGRRRVDSEKPGGASHPRGPRRTRPAARGVPAHPASHPPGSTVSHVDTDSEEGEAEFDLSTTPRRPKRTGPARSAPGRGATIVKQANLVRSVDRPSTPHGAPSEQRLDSSGGDDSDFRLSRPRTAANVAKGPYGVGGRGRRDGGRGGSVGGSSVGGGSGATVGMAELLSDDDANDWLRNTDSEDDRCAATGCDGSGSTGSTSGVGGGTVEDSGGAILTTAELLSDDDANDCLRNTDSDDASAASGDDSDGPVLCRCGARDWQDGTRWIQCDARGCRRWEHLKCAYPERSHEVNGPEGEELSPPEVHLCVGCSVKGVSAAAGKARRGGRRFLTRCGEGGPRPSPTRVSGHETRSGGGGGVSDGGGANGLASRVRRSERVSGKESARVTLTKNVVGAELSSSASSDEIGIGPRSGSLNDDRGLGGASSDDDGFWAPEGHVETSQEYRCRCGDTLQDDGDAIGGGDGEGGNASGRWVQCHADACGVWEHAACCDHGCSLSAPASETNRARRHWCRSCDPRGRKHARWEEKMRKKMNRELAAKCVGTTGKAGSGSAVEGEMGGGARGEAKRQADERERALLGDIWRGVIFGDASLLEEIFRKVDGGNDGPGISVERLLAAGQSPPACWLDLQFCCSGGGDGDGRKGADAGGDDSPPPDGCPVPAGLSVLMLAAGFWKNVVRASAAPAAPAAATALVHPDSSTQSLPVVAGVRTAQPVPGTETHPAAERNAESDASGAPPAPSTEAADAVDARASSEGQSQDQSNTEGGGASAEKTGAAVPPASTEVSAPTARRKDLLPHLGSEARLAVLRLVLERSGTRAVLASDGDGRTAIHHAAAVNGAAETALLLGGKLGEEAALAKSQERLTPLQVCAAAGHAETCVALLRSLPSTGTRAAVLAAANDGEDTFSGETALHLACLEGHAACVRAILDEDGELERELAEEMTGHVVRGIPAETPATHHPLVLAKTAEGETPLMAAAGCPSPACVELVIQNLRQRIFPHPWARLAELRAVNRSGMNALHYAAGRAAEGSVEAAKAVLDAERSIAFYQAPGQPWCDDPAAMINSGDADNEASPLHLAAAISHKEMVTLLLNEGANSVLEDRQGWTPVMYADFDGRKEGAVLELLQHEPERQLEALGRVLSSREGRNEGRIGEVVRNLVTVPSFFSLVNGFIRKNPASLLGSLSFLKNEPGLLDFENKRTLMRTLLSDPDEDTRNALDLVAGPPPSGFGYGYDQIYTRRGPGQALSALLDWMESAVRRWGESGLAAWLRINRPSFNFEGEAGHGPGVDREGWEMVAGDLVLPCPRRAASQALGVPGAAKVAAPATPSSDGDNLPAFFVLVDEGMSSYCPRDLRGGGHESEAARAVGGGGAGGDGDAAVEAMEGRVQREEDLQAFELLGMVIGFNLAQNKVLNLNLNPVVWKTMLSRKVALSDLDLVDATYYKSLMQVQDMDGVDQLGLSFAYLDLSFCADVEGIRPDDEVTDENKALYASLALESRTFGRWRKQARALSRGLRRLVPLALLKMFTENELGLLLSGPGDIDPADWERHTDFDGDPELKGWFWSVVRTLNKEERSLLLQFATGCSRLPAGGFSGLARTFNVMVVAFDFERPLPRAATCFYTLKLPRYPDLYCLRKYLLVAIRHGAAGFEFS
eukprot:g15043.t1